MKSTTRMKQDKVIAFVQANPGVSMNKTALSRVAGYEPRKGNWTPAIMFINKMIQAGLLRHDELNRWYADIPPVYKNQTASKQGSLTLKDLAAEFSSATGSNDLWRFLWWLDDREAEIRRMLAELDEGTDA